MWPVQNFKWQKAHITEEVFRKVNGKRMDKRMILALVGLDSVVPILYSIYKH